MKKMGERVFFGILWFAVLGVLFLNQAECQPNLTPYQPPGWSDKMVISNVPGTNADSGVLYETDTLYLDYAFFNDGTLATSVKFNAYLYINERRAEIWSVDPPVTTDVYFYVEDFTLKSIGAGTHTLKMVLDPKDVIAETNEGDNEYSRTITIHPASSGKPDLTGEWTSLTQTCKSNKSGLKCKISGTLKIENRGDGDAISTSVDFWLSDDNAWDAGDKWLKRVSTGKIKAGGYKNKKLSYSLPKGETASGKNIIGGIDEDDAVDETDEYNNDIAGPIP